jgi:excisionase family DNA binding protein
MDYLTVTQAAAALGLSVRGLRFRIAHGQMAAEQVSPRLYLIPRAEVERWKALGRQKPGPKPKAPQSTT